MKKILVLPLVCILLLSLSACTKSTNPVYGHNVGRYTNEFSKNTRELHINGLEKNQIVLRVYFLPNQIIHYQVIEGLNRGHTFRDGKDKWRIYNNYLHLTFNNSLISLKGNISEPGNAVKGTWKNHKWEDLPVLKYFAATGTFSGFKVK